VIPSSCSNASNSAVFALQSPNRRSQVSDAAAGTTKKLQKYAILAEYFRGFSDADLRLAVRFAAGRTFAATDERVLAVGGAIVSDVILRLLRVDPQVYHDTVVSSGEIGEAISKLWSTSPDSLAPSRPPLTLHDLCECFEDLSSTGNVRRKSEILAELFSRCAFPREAAYVAKIIFGDMRTGVQEGLLQAAVAQAFAKPLAAGEYAFILYNSQVKVVGYFAGGGDSYFDFGVDSP